MHTGICRSNISPSPGLPKSTQRHTLTHTYTHPVSHTSSRADLLDDLLFEILCPCADSKVCTAVPGIGPYWRIWSLDTWDKVTYYQNQKVNLQPFNCQHRLQHVKIFFYHWFLSLSKLRAASPYHDWLANSSPVGCGLHCPWLWLPRSLMLDQNQMSALSLIRHLFYH